jgi:ethanolamine transporter EutH
VFSPWSVPEKKVRKWMWIGLTIVAALQFYYVQEMIAAFVVLGVVFALMAGASLLVFLVDRASERTLGSVETETLAILRTAHRGANFVATLAAQRAAARGEEVSLFNRTRLRHPRLGTAR